MNIETYKITANFYKFNFFLIASNKNPVMQKSTFIVHLIKKWIIPVLVLPFDTTFTAFPLCYYV